MARPVDAKIQKRVETRKKKNEKKLVYVSTCPPLLSFSHHRRCHPHHHQRPRRRHVIAIEHSTTRRICVRDSALTYLFYFIFFFHSFSHRTPYNSNSIPYVYGTSTRITHDTSGSSMNTANENINSN